MRRGGGNTADSLVEKAIVRLEEGLT